MPPFTRNRPRDQLRFVTMNAQNLVFAFKTFDISGLPNVGQADLDVIGHLQAAPANSLVIFRANSPKPPRVKKAVVDGGATGGGASTQASVSTYAAPAAATSNEAIAAGWSLAKTARGTTIGQTPRSISAIARLSNGINYVFPMNSTDFTEYTDELGLINPATINTDAERGLLVRASSRPKPGRATRTLPDGSSFQSFYSSGSIDTAIAAGFTVSQEVLF